MSRVIMFAKVFPKYHKKACLPTFFKDQILLGLEYEKNETFLPSRYVKVHTIRAGNRWKAGDSFSPRVWEGLPYRSKQIIIAPDLIIKRVWDFVIEVDRDYICVLIDGHAVYEENNLLVTQVAFLENLAFKDGLLSVDDFKSWFKWGKQAFSGQIICWSDKVIY